MNQQSQTSPPVPDVTGVVRFGIDARSRSGGFYPLGVRFRGGPGTIVESGSSAPEPTKAGRLSDAKARLDAMRTDAARVAEQDDWEGLKRRAKEASYQAHQEENAERRRLGLPPLPWLKD